LAVSFGVPAWIIPAKAPEHATFLKWQIVCWQS